MSHHAITHLLDSYGLAVVFLACALQAAGPPVPGTTVLIAGAVYAATGHGLPIIGVIAAGALGAVLGTSVGFLLGRWRGAEILRWLTRRLRRDPAQVDGLRRVAARRGGTWLIAARFITGVRNVSGLLAGTSGMSWWRFVSYASGAALAWASINALEYYWFGRALAAADTWVQVLLVLLGIAWLIVSVRVLHRRAVAELGDLGRAE